METLFFQLVIIYLVRSSAFIPAENESYIVTIKNVDFRGMEKFPARIEVVFSYQDNVISLLLQKDDDTTQLLSEDLFHTSKILPSGLFKDKEKDNFAAYESSKSDVIVVHRETSDSSPKFYGRFTHDSNRMVIHAEGGSHKSHRVKRELNEDKDHHRTGRATTDDIIELFIFADLSVYEHIATELLPGKTETEVKTFIKNYLTALGKEVDTIYQYLGKYGDIGTIRVYFQQYQIITASQQQKWVENNLLNNRLQATSTDDLQAYYFELMTKFAFPYTDHLMAVTKLDMEGDLQVMSTGTVCGESSAIATSIIRIDTFTISMAQGIALTFNVPLDGDSNNCLSSDQYIMSDNYAPATSNSNQANRWKFSSCSVDQFKAAFSGGLDLSCLQTQDSVFDFDAYEEAAYISELLTLDEQCVLRYEAESTFCDDVLGNTVDCYSSTQGCTVSGSCSPFTVPQLTPCDTGETAGNYLCSFGFCISINSSATEGSNSSTSSSTSTTTTTTQPPLPPVRSTMMFFSSSLQTTSSTQSTTTNADALQTTTGEIDCTPEISYEYYNLPGCSCSGCNVKSEKDNDDCLKSPDCIGKKVRVATRIIPESCISLYQPGPRRVILTASEAESTELNAEVFKGNNGKWKVELVKNP